MYIPFNQALLLLFSFPVLLGILSQIRYHLFKEIAKVQDQEPDAYVDYRNRIAAYSSQSNDRIQALLQKISNIGKEGLRKQAKSATIDLTSQFFS